MKFSTDINRLFENFDEQGWDSTEDSYNDISLSRTIQKQVKLAAGDRTYVKVDGSTVPILLSGKQVVPGLTIEVQIEGETLAILIDCNKEYDETVQFLQRKMQEADSSPVKKYIMDNIADDLLEKDVNYITLAVKTKKSNKMYEFGDIIKSYILCLNIGKNKTEIMASVQPTGYASSAKTYKNRIFQMYFTYLFDLVDSNNLRNVITLHSVSNLGVSDQTAGRENYTVNNVFEMDMSFLAVGRLNNNVSKLNINIPQNTSELVINDIEDFARFFDFGEFKAEYKGGYVENNINVQVSNAGKNIGRLNDLSLTIKGDVSFTNGINITNLVSSTSYSPSASRMKIDLSGCYSSGVFIINEPGNMEGGTEQTDYRTYRKMSSLTIVLPDGANIPVLGFESSISMIQNPYFKLIGPNTNISYFKFMCWNNQYSISTLSNIETIFPRFTRNLNPNLIDRVFFTLASSYSQQTEHLKILLDDINLHPDYDFKNKIVVNSQ